MAALLPFCIEKTKSVREPSAVAAAVPVNADRIAAVRAVIYSELWARRVAGPVDNYTTELLRIIGAATGQDLSPAQVTTATSNGRTNYPAGSIVMVTGGNASHKRVVGKGYLIVQAGAEPTPLGLRQSDFSGRKFNAGGRSDIRIATDAEVSATLAGLNDAQVKTLVCELSAQEPWRTVLADVIRNDGGASCRR